MRPFSYFVGLLLCLLAIRPASAQSLPNNGFDTWASPYGVEAPAGWLTTDDLLSFFNKYPRGSYNTGTVTKTTDVHGGPFAASLNTLSLPTTSGGTVTVPGLLVLGAKSGTYTYRGLPIGGAAYAARPTQFQFYYKLAGPAADSASAFIYFTNTVNGAPNLIGRAIKYLAPTNGSYAAVSLPIQYDPSTSALPDSVHIAFSSGDANKITGGTVLQVDDIALTNTALATRADAALQDLLSVAPNPSPAGRFVVSSPAQPELAAAPLAVFDVMGRTVLTQPAQAAAASGRELDLSSLPTGIYTLRLLPRQGAIVRQLVVK